MISQRFSIQDCAQSSKSFSRSMSRTDCDIDCCRLPIDSGPPGLGSSIASHGGRERVRGGLRQGLSPIS